LKLEAGLLIASNFKVDHNFILERQFFEYVEQGMQESVEALYRTGGQLALTMVPIRFSRTIAIFHRVENWL